MGSALHNPAVTAASTSSKGRTILYWIMTVLVAFPIGSGGIAQLMQYFATPHRVVPVLPYPMYFFALLLITGSTVPPWPLRPPSRTFAAIFPAKAVTA